MKATRPAVIVAALACLLLASGQARVYECIDPATGAVTFSDLPCTRGAQATERVVRPNSLDASGSRELVLKNELREMEAQLRAQQAQLQAQQAQLDALSRQTGDTATAPRIDSRACAQATRSYELSAASLLGNQAEIEMKRSAMYGACGMREPDRNEVNVHTEVHNHAQRRRTGPISARCDAAACWDAQGNRYERAPDGTYFGPHGPCRRSGDSLRCF